MYTHYLLSLPFSCRNLFSCKVCPCGIVDLSSLMSGSGGLNPSEAGETFLYTPHGVAVAVVMAVVMTSLVWLSACVCYCCWRYKHTHHDRAGDLSSPYNNALTSNVESPHFSYSINSLASEPAFHHTSLESILNGEAELEGKSPPRLENTD